MASGNSRALPVNSFLSQSVAPVFKISHLSECLIWLSKCLPRKKLNHNQADRHSSLNNCHHKKHCYNRREFISTLSDVFCITGGITVVTGTLVASFGIFPRNQASIRLYLEFIGCSMVIVGVLILFASLKLKLPNTRVMAASDDLIFFTNSGSIGQARLDRHNLAVPLESLDQRAPLTVVKRQVTVCSEIQRMVEHESNRCDSLDDSSIQSSSWIPQDAYGNDHQAAIEAALSTVLAVSTLVGFRAHQALSEDQESGFNCCLHHTIQHTIKAKKWIRRLRSARDWRWPPQAMTGDRCDPLMLQQRNIAPDSSNSNRNKDSSQNMNETKDVEVETSFCG